MKPPKFNVIYADPPWRYSDKRSGKLGGAENHYPTMSLNELKALPVESVAAKDCLLFIWVTFPTLTDALELIESWGFRYKTLGFAWVKTNPRQNVNQASFFPTDVDDFFGIGAYTKSNCEVCLIATKGKAAQLVKHNDVPSTIIAPRQRHSRKPDEARKRIERLVGDGVGQGVPKLELFARESFAGWHVWGNEIESDVQLG